MKNKLSTIVSAINQLLPIYTSLKATKKGIIVNVYISKNSITQFAICLNVPIGLIRCHGIY